MLNGLPHLLVFSLMLFGVVLAVVGAVREVFERKGYSLLVHSVAIQFHGYLVACFLGFVYSEGHAAGLVASEPFWTGCELMSFRLLCWLGSWMLRGSLLPLVGFGLYRLWTRIGDKKERGA